MQQLEQYIVDAFEQRSALDVAEVLAVGERHAGHRQVRQAYFSLLTKGILAEDDYGTVTISRAQALAYDTRYPLLEPVDED